MKVFEMMFVMMLSLINIVGAVLFGDYIWTLIDHGYMATAGMAVIAATIMCVGGEVGIGIFSDDMLKEEV